ncbi:hypothetical protein [Streptomyces sp. NPDC001903]|uniref:hypothetical protein n=1 Tax=Streptomyces sp. NPDC001903 TaxID=3364622 RepID=UPI0036A24709
MSFPLGKLTELSVVKSQDSDGEDRIVMSRVGGVQFLPDQGTVTVQQGEVWNLDDMEIFLPFAEADGDVEVALHAVKNGTSFSLGTVFLRADEANHGELQKQFEGAGALYKLKYKVLP